MVVIGTLQVDTCGVPRDLVIHKCTLVKRVERQAALALKALGEPRRVGILRVLKAGPRSVGEIAAEVDVTQQAASQHLAVLGKAGLVEARKEGTRHVYAIKPDGTPRRDKAARDLRGARRPDPRRARAQRPRSVRSCEARDRLAALHRTAWRRGRRWRSWTRSVEDVAAAVGVALSALFNIRS